MNEPPAAVVPVPILSNANVPSARIAYGVGIVEAKPSVLGGTHVNRTKRSTFATVFGVPVTSKQSPKPWSVSPQKRPGTALGAGGGVTASQETTPRVAHVVDPRARGLGPNPQRPGRRRRRRPERALDPGVEPREGDGRREGPGGPDAGLGREVVRERELTSGLARCLHIESDLRDDEPEHPVLHLQAQAHALARCPAVRPGSCGRRGVPWKPANHLAIGRDAVAHVCVGDVPPGPAHQPVRSRSADERVRSRSADERVRPRAADEDVVPPPADEPVVSASAVETVGARRAAEDVVSRRTDNGGGERRHGSEEQAERYTEAHDEWSS